MFISLFFTVVSTALVIHGCKYHQDRHQHDKHVITLFIAMSHFCA